MVGAVLNFRITHETPMGLSETMHAISDIRNLVHSLLDMNIAGVRNRKKISLSSTLIKSTPSSPDGTQVFQQVLNTSTRLEPLEKKMDKIVEEVDLSRREQTCRMDRLESNQIHI